MRVLEILLIVFTVRFVDAYFSGDSTRIHQIAERAAAPWPRQTFKTLPDVTPPVFNISKSGEPLAQGDILFTPISAPGIIQIAALIMADTGELVWNSLPEPNASFTNLFVQELDSKPTLHYWTGAADLGVMGYGHVSILDETYTEIYRVCPEATAVTVSGMTFPCYADIHESFITERGSILITMYNVTTADLSLVNGTKGDWVFDCLFFDVDIKTNKTLFRWSALEAGLPITSSKAPPTGSFGDGSRTAPYDWFHINSVQSVGDGYLVNGRHVWTSYKLNATGDIEWEIQGDTGGDFILPEDGLFSWEHHARVQSFTQTDVKLSYMNNFNAAGALNGSHASEGLELHLNLITKTATVLKNLTDPKESIYNDAQGTFDALSNGNTLLGYGAVPVMKEFGPHNDSDVRMTIRYGLNDISGAGAQSYRIYRQEWVGTPAAPPVAVVQDGVVYMSWNGATGITSWEIFAGNVEGYLKPVGQVKSMGFETSFKLPGSCGGFVEVAAFRGGQLLRYSNSVTVA